MIDHEIINEKILHDIRTSQLREQFDNASPFRFIILDDFLHPEFAHKILEFFPSIRSMDVKYDGINERKAEDTNFNLLDHHFHSLHRALVAPEFIHSMESLTGIHPLHCINDRLGYGIHQGGNKSFLDIHIDYNIHPVRKLQRRLNFLLFFNPGWQNEWGGYLEFWDDGVKNCIQSIAPVFNRAVIFECSNVSYHGYNKMNLPDGITRKSYYHYYFAQSQADIRYHDTIFKARPKDPLLKKMSTDIKEYFKNSIKKTLLNLGLERFLK